MKSFGSLTEPREYASLEEQIKAEAWRLDYIDYGGARPDHKHSAGYGYAITSRNHQKCPKPSPEPSSPRS